MSIERFEQLEVWREAHQVVLEIYKVTSKLPSEEKFGLVSQMRRAAVSVPGNIAEGFKRRGGADKKHFYNIAQLRAESLPDCIERVGRMLTGLIRSVPS